MCTQQSVSPSRNPGQADAQLAEEYACQRMLMDDAVFDQFVISLTNKSKNSPSRNRLGFIDSGRSTIILKASDIFEELPQMIKHGLGIFECRSRLIKVCTVDLDSVGLCSLYSRSLGCNYHVCKSPVQLITMKCC